MGDSLRKVLLLRRRSVSRFNGEAIAEFLKCCGFNARETEKIVYALRYDSGSANVKNKGPALSEQRAFSVPESVRSVPQNGSSSVLMENTVC